MANKIPSVNDASLQQKILKLNDLLSIEKSKTAHYEKLLVRYSNSLNLEKIIRNMAHQLKQPLSSASLRLQLIDEDSNGKFSEDVQVVLKKFAAIDNMIEEFKDLFIPNKMAHQLDLNACIKKILSSMTTHFSNHATAINHHATDNIQINISEYDFSILFIHLILIANSLFRPNSGNKYFIDITTVLEDKKINFYFKFPDVDSVLIDKNYNCLNLYNNSKELGEELALRLHVCNYIAINNFKSSFALDTITMAETNGSTVKCVQFHISFNS